MVFVDGVLSNSLSKTSAIPADIIACSLSTLEASKCAEIDIDSMLEYIPDVKELPRNSYASDIITSLNSVRCNALKFCLLVKGMPSRSTGITLTTCATVNCTSQSPQST